MRNRQKRLSAGDKIKFVYHKVGGYEVIYSQSWSSCYFTYLFFNVLVSFSPVFFFFFLPLKRKVILFIFIFGCAGFSLLHRHSLVATSRSYSLLAVHGLLVEVTSLVWNMCSVVVAHRLSCGIFPDQGLNPCLLHWQATLYHCITREAFLFLF